MIHDWEGFANLAKSAVENEGVFALDILSEIGDLVVEIPTRVVQRSCYVPVAAPLVVPFYQIKFLTKKIKISEVRERR